MSKFAEACKLSYFEWEATLPQIDDIPEPQYSKNHIKQIAKLFDKMRGDRYHYFTRKAIRTMIVAAVLMALVLSAFVIPSSREFLMENFDIFGVYKITQHNNNSINGEIEVGYIPEGYELVETENYDKLVTNIYETEDGMRLKILKNSSSAEASINIENISKKEYYIEGIQYICIKNSVGFNYIIWNENDYIYQVYGIFSDEELLEIAQTVK